MKVWAPCPIGQPFTAARCGHVGYQKFYVTGMTFFYWSLKTFDNMTLCGKKQPDWKEEHTDFFHRRDLEKPPAIEFEVPTQIIQPGYPLRELGLDTDAVGFLSSIEWEPETGHQYRIGYGRNYGGPYKYVRTDALDKLFGPILSHQAVKIDVMDFLI